MKKITLRPDTFTLNHGYDSTTYNDIQCSDSHVQTVQTVQTARTLSNEILHLDKLRA